MPLAFNFDGKRPLPRVISSRYAFARLERSYPLLVDGKEMSIQVESIVKAAWTHLSSRCASSKTCNDYFAAIPQGKGLTLSQCMEQNTFYIHRLSPKTDPRSGKTYPETDLPLANTAGSDIGLSLGALVDGSDSTERLAATLLHEIAHFAGASTNTRDEHSLDAEKALFPCGLGQYYSELAKG